MTDTSNPEERVQALCGLELGGSKLFLFLDHVGEGENVSYVNTAFTLTISLYLTIQG